MQQLTFAGAHRLEWTDVPRPELGSGDAALVRPVAVATCDLDAAALSGRAPLPGPFAFGHEFVADVIDVGGAVTSAKAGDRVIVPFQVSCGTCDFCRRGLTGSCATAGAGAAYGMAPIARREWGGALSDCVRVPYADAMLVALPAGLDPASVASVSDNVPDGWRAVAPELERRPGAPVLIVGGAGDVALYAVATAVALGSEQVDYVDTDARRLAVAEGLGAQAIEQRVDGSRLGRYPITVDHSSDAAGLQSALRSTEPEGTCTSTAIYFTDVALPILEMYTRGVVFRTGRVNARAAIPSVLDLIATGRLQPERVTSAVVQWDDAPDALANLDAKTVLVR
jgi:threonine dehydrogenase-like Zn-dependent dehydrogenase